MDGEKESVEIFEEDYLRLVSRRDELLEKFCLQDGFPIEATEEAQKWERENKEEIKKEMKAALEDLKGNKK